MSKRLAQADLGRLEQQELSAESAWISALRIYKQALDNFKIQLGLSTDATIVLADTDLDQLKILHPEISVDDSIKVARRSGRTIRQGITGKPAPEPWRTRAG